LFRFLVFFQQIGTDVIVVSNPYEPQSNWKYKTSRVPGTNNDTSLNLGITYNYEDRYFYLFGTVSNKIFLGRINENSLINFQWNNNLEYWSTNTWVTDITKASTLYTGPYSESTIFYHNYMKQWYMIGCQAIDTNIYIFTSTNLTGPWTRTLAYSIAPPWNNGSYFSYAAKAHPEYTKNDTITQIVFTYNIQPVGGAAAICQQINTYTPRFVQLDITQ